MASEPYCAIVVRDRASVRRDEPGHDHQRRRERHGLRRAVAVAGPESSRNVSSNGPRRQATPRSAPRRARVRWPCSAGTSARRARRRRDPRHPPRARTAPDMAGREQLARGGPEPLQSARRAVARTVPAPADERTSNGHHGAAGTPRSVVLLVDDLDTIRACAGGAASSLARCRGRLRWSGERPSRSVRCRCHRPSPTREVRPGECVGRRRRRC